MAAQHYVPTPASIQAAMDGPSYPNPNLAVYSSVPVYEMMVRGIGVMRRRDDSWLNATQILKVAGVDKGKRTKILEKDIAQGVHEKVQGGYGRYQGTWIPFERAVELANAFGVSHLLAPLFDYTAPPPPVALNGAAAPPAIQNPYALAQPLPPPPPQPQPMHHQPLPPPPQDTNAILRQAQQQGLLPPPNPTQGGMHAGPSRHKRMSDAMEQEEAKRFRLEHQANGGGAYGAPQPQPQQQQQQPAEATPPAHLFAPKKYLSNFRTSLTASTKSPLDPSQVDLNALERNRTALKSIFAQEAELPGADLASLFPPDLDPDTPIDENQHTALHWAAALARTHLVHALVAFGADINRGNNVGETPLIRAVLVTNNSDQDAFLRLLEALGPSLRTVDDVGRSVLHHAALVAGVKGRAVSARYYLDTVLEYVARQEQGQFGGLIDAQDAYGDTALNIAARLGNRSIVKALLDAGADKMKPNKLGLRATDYGLDAEELAYNPADDLLAGSPPPLMSKVPVQTSQDVLRSVQDALSSVSSRFDAELVTKTTELDTHKAKLQDLTRTLADLRREQKEWQAEVRVVDDQAQRVKNLQTAIDEEDAFDWTGRTEVDGSPASALAGPGFTYRGPESTLSGLPTGIGMSFDTDPPAPEMEGGVVSGEALVHLLRLQAWYERVEGLMTQRVEKLEDGNGELEKKLRRMVASISGVEEDHVDERIEEMLAAFHSEINAPDDRVANFVNHVVDGAQV
ncbi:transcriptional regulator swi6 [Rhodosporidiobolus nylandii]